MRLSGEQEHHVRLLELFALQSNRFIGQAGHPEAFVQYIIDGLIVIFRAGVNEPQKTLDDRCRGAVALEIDQGFALTCARYL